MNYDDIDENPKNSCTTKLPVPTDNDAPLKDVERWARKVYHQVYLKVGWRKAGKIKGIMPIEMADYAVRKTFGNWRLVAPVRDGEKSPLQQALEALRPYIAPERWGIFRRGIRAALKNHLHGHLRIRV